MVRIASFLSIGAMILVAGLACGPSVPKPPDQIDVKGKVTLDGKPLPEGEISFSQTGMPGRISTIKDGEFSGKAYPGSNKVEIQAFKQGPPLSTDIEKKPTKIPSLPAKYNTESKLEAKAEKGGANEFKFEVTSN